MAGGDFSIDFVAAEPTSYNHQTGGGAFDDDTSNVDTVESLQGGEFACGDIVTFFAVVSVDNTQQAMDDGPQTIEMDFSFLANSTGQPGAAFSDVVTASAEQIPRICSVIGLLSINGSVTSFLASLMRHPPET